MPSRGYQAGTPPGRGGGFLRKFSTGSISPAGTGVAGPGSGTFADKDGTANGSGQAPRAAGPLSSIWASTAVSWASIFFDSSASDTLGKIPCSTVAAGSPALILETKGAT